MPTTIKSLFLALSLVSFVGCGEAPADEELPAAGGAAGEVAAGGTAGAAAPTGKGGAAGGLAGSTGSTGGSSGTGGAHGTGGAVGTGGSSAGTGGAGGAVGTGGAGGASAEPLCGDVLKYTICIRRNPNKSGLKGGRWCATCFGSGREAECTFITPDKTDEDVACVTDCTECDTWL